MRLDSNVQLAQLADELRAISATALFYCQSPSDRTRFAKVRSLAAELLATVDERDAIELENLFQQDSTPRSPLVGADAAILRRDQRLLLVNSLDGHGWRLPGGLVDIGESPAHAAARHARAEVGVEVTVTGIVAVYDTGQQLDNQAFQTLRHVHRCEIASGAPETTAPGISGWFNVHEAMRLPLCPGQREIIEHILRREDRLPAFRIRTPVFHGVSCN